MTTPAALSDDQVVWIYGRFAHLNGTPMANAKMSVKPQVSALLNLNTDTIISHQSFMTTTDDTGFFSLPIPAADAPSIDPQGFTYTVYEPTYRVYDLTVTLAGTDIKVDGPLAGKRAIDLIDAVPVDAPVSGTALLLRGDPGRGITSTHIDNGRLFVTYTDGIISDVGPIGDTVPLLGVENLVDVKLEDVPSEQSVLARDPVTGIFTNIPLSVLRSSEQRGSIITFVDAAPTSVPSDAQVGDYFVVVSGESAGQVFEVQEDGA